MKQQKIHDAFDKAIEYIFNSPTDYCMICPRLRECNVEAAAQGDEWEQSRDVCKAMLEKYFMNKE